MANPQATSAATATAATKQSPKAGDILQEYEDGSYSVYAHSRGGHKTTERIFNPSEGALEKWKTVQAESTQRS